MEPDGKTRYVQSGDRWTCPPGETYAESYGLSFALRTSDELNPFHLSNIDFLEEYFLPNVPDVPDDVAAWCREYLQGHARTSLAHLIADLPPQVTSDHIYTLLAREQIFAPLHRVRLTEIERVPLFVAAGAVVAWEATQQSTTPIDRPALPRPVVITAGSHILYDGEPWIIGALHNDHVLLVHDGGTTTKLPLPTFQDFVQSGLIQSADNTLDESSALIADRYARATDEDLAEADRRMALIAPHLTGDPNAAALDRRGRRYLQAYKTWEALGDGYAGLLPQTKDRGNRTPRWDLLTLQRLDDFIATEFESAKQPNMWTAWVVYQRQCEEAGVPAVSYKYFTERVHARDQEEQMRKRRGPRAAYQASEAHGTASDEPRHGSYPLHRAHIDHTEVNMQTVSERFGIPLDKPWWTVMMDDTTRRILAMVLMFERPSYRACLLVVRECVRRHGRLPKTIMVDNGAEFHSVYFQRLLARYHSTVEYRMPHGPRFGSTMERIIGSTTTQVINSLRGNTQMAQHPRQTSASFNPKKLAVWTLPALNEALEQWCYEVYDAMEHSALGQSPRASFEQGLKVHGERKWVAIAYDEKFRMATLPPVDRTGTRKVQAGRGIVRQKILYWHDSFKDPRVVGTNIEVKYDPFDVGVMYAWVDHHWVRCISEYYQVFRGRTEREISFASQELEQGARTTNRNRYTVTARRLADYLQENTNKEKVLIQQREAAGMRHEEAAVTTEPKPKAPVEPPKPGKFRKMPGVDLP